MFYTRSMVIHMFSLDEKEKIEKIEKIEKNEKNEK